MNWLWLVVAFLGGGFCTWKYLCFASSHGLRSPAIVTSALAKLTYDDLCKLRLALGKEIGRRVAP